MRITKRQLRRIIQETSMITTPNIITPDRIASVMEEADGMLVADGYSTGADYDTNRMVIYLTPNALSRTGFERIEVDADYDREGVDLDIIGIPGRTSPDSTIGPVIELTTYIPAKDWNADMLVEEIKSLADEPLDIYEASNFVTTVSGKNTLSTRSEKQKVNEQDEARAFYSDKLKLIMMAAKALEEAIALERTSPMGEDPDLNDLYDDLLGYMEAVAAMVDGVGR